MSRPPSFDHEEARRLRAGGMSYAAISRELGVSYDAVRYAAAPLETRKRRVSEARQYVADRRATGKHYDYTPCPKCGKPRDRRRNACADCYSAARHEVAVASAAAKDAIRKRAYEVRDELFVEINLLMDVEGLTRREVALRTGVAEQSIWRWRKFGLPERSSRRGRVGGILADESS